MIEISQETGTIQRNFQNVEHQKLQKKFGGLAGHLSLVKTSNSGTAILSVVAHRTSCSKSFSLTIENFRTDVVRNFPSPPIPEMNNDRSSVNSLRVKKITSFRASEVQG